MIKENHSSRYNGPQFRQDEPKQLKREQCHWCQNSFLGSTYRQTLELLDRHMRKKHPEHVIGNGQEE